MWRLPLLSVPCLRQAVPSMRAVFKHTEDTGTCMYGLWSLSWHKSVALLTWMHATCRQQVNALMPAAVDSSFPVNASCTSFI